ncbi:unnamed protein product [Clonostachys byssicola]|uniref:Uncharacterized protein n=1 Tax=Clonostachys byssicola TaxID=160290 RepID=A0A9N9UL91_9HYPO|nr:unnamed protein product [Clonostachys byssicola]
MTVTQEICSLRHQAYEIKRCIERHEKEPAFGYDYVHHQRTWSSPQDHKNQLIILERESLDHNTILSTFMLA